MIFIYNKLPKETAFILLDFNRGLPRLKSSNPCLVKRWFLLFSIGCYFEWLNLKLAFWLKKGRLTTGVVIAIWEGSMFWQMPSSSLLARPQSRLYLLMTCMGLHSLYVTSSKEACMIVPGLTQIVKGNYVAPLALCMTSASVPSFKITCLLGFLWYKKMDDNISFETFALELAY